MLNDQIADLLTRVRNAQRAGHRYTTVRDTKMVRRVLDVLKREGFIGEYEKAEVTGTGGIYLTVGLKYYDSGKPVISTARRISTSGRREYRQVADIPKVFSGLGIAIISTSKGVMSDREARREKVGGELVALVG